jgi:hypothetical protein
MGENRFYGTWKLVSSEFRDSHGNVSYPYGEDAAGLAMLDNDGHLSAQLMRTGRPAFASNDLHRGTPEEIKAAFEGYVAYFGRYEVNEHERSLTTHVQASLFPNWIGGDQVRYYEFSANRLTLRTPPMVISGGTATGFLIWERVSPAV